MGLTECGGEASSAPPEALMARGRQGPHGAWVPPGEGWCQADAPWKEQVVRRQGLTVAHERHQMWPSCDPVVSLPVIVNPQTVLRVNTIEIAPRLC